VGSSSFRFWPQTDTVFAHYDVVNAGFGGSCFEDLWRLRGPLIYSLEPDVLLVYEGDNDLFDGVPEPLILDAASRLLQELAQKLPATRLVVVAPKASPARYHLSKDYMSLNAKLKSIVENRVPRGWTFGAHSTKKTEPFATIYSLQINFTSTTKDTLFGWNP
jgi:hypothetical protein